MAGEYVFYALKKSVLARTGAQPAPLPVRASEAKRLFRGRTVPVVEILEELDTFLAEHPEEQDRCRGAAALYARLFGAALGQDGQLNAAGRCFEIGLARGFDDPAMRAQYAVVLDGLGMLEDAVGEYRRVVDDPAVAVDPLVWILAARALAQHGDRERALALLNECRPLVPDDPVVARLTRELEKAPRKPAKRGAGERPAASARYCTECGSPISAGKRFCSSCGHPARG